MRRGSYRGTQNPSPKPQAPKRYFIALMTDKGTKDLIRSGNRKLISEARNLNFVDLEQTHLTLQFLGNDLSDDSLGAIRERLRAVIPEHKTPEVKVTELHFGFRGQHIARVLHWDVEATPQLRELSKVIHSEIKKLGLPDVRREKDYQRLSFHITAARARHKVSRSFGRRINQLIKNLADLGTSTFLADKVYLMRSNFTIKGVKYEVVEEFKSNPKSR